MAKYFYSLVFFFFLGVSIFIVTHSGPIYKAHWDAYWDKFWWAVILGFIIGGGGPAGYVIYTDKTAGDPSRWPIFVCWLIGILLIIVPYSVSLGS